MFMGIVADFDISSYSTKLQSKYVLVYIWKCIIGTWLVEVTWNWETRNDIGR